MDNIIINYYNNNNITNIFNIIKNNIKNINNIKTIFHININNVDNNIVILKILLM